MFLFYSASPQFVLVEGFKKLKLKDARVQKPSKAHIGHLKMVRHATYHFVHEEGRAKGQCSEQRPAGFAGRTAITSGGVKLKAQIERF